MNPEIKAKWIAALRSGEYQQGVNQLKTEVGFCCYGVLCDLHAKETGGQWDADSYKGQSALPHRTIMHWAGFEFYPKLQMASWGDDKPHCLDYYNDQGATFTQIADAIEKEL